MAKKVKVVETEKGFELRRGDEVVAKVGFDRNDKESVAQAKKWAKAKAKEV